MPQALLQWDGNPGPYDQLDVGVGVTVSNDDVGGEFQWDFTLTRKPIGSASTLVGAGNSRTLVPDREGTYVVNVIVNNNPSLVDESAAAVLYYPSNLREPAPRETLEWDPVDGWSSDPAFHQIWERANNGVGAKPVASAAVWGRFWHVPGGIGVADTFEVCLKDAADTYNWENIVGGGGGSSTLSIVNKSFANHNDVLTAGEVDDTYLRVDTSGGLTNLFLPATPASGTRVRIKRVGGNTLTITPSGGDTIETAGILTYNINRTAYTLIYVASVTDWEIF